MSKDEGIELPGLDGRWRKSWISETGHWVQFERVLNAQVPIEVGDGVVIGLELTQCYHEGVVVKVNPETVLVVTVDGRRESYHKSHVAEIWRDGECVWEREG